MSTWKGQACKWRLAGWQQLRGPAVCTEHRFFMLTSSWMQSHNTGHGPGTGPLCQTPLTDSRIQRVSQTTHLSDCMPLWLSNAADPLGTVATVLLRGTSPTFPRVQWPPDSSPHTHRTYSQQMGACVSRGSEGKEWLPFTETVLSQLTKQK